jgi:hypothetical protein
MFSANEGAGDDIATNTAVNGPILSYSGNQSQARCQRQRELNAQASFLSGAGPNDRAKILYLSRRCNQRSTHSINLSSPTEFPLDTAFFSHRNLAKRVSSTTGSRYNGQKISDLLRKA